MVQAIDHTIHASCLQRQRSWRMFRSDVVFQLANDGVRLLLMPPPSIRLALPGAGS